MNDTAQEPALQAHAPHAYIRRRGRMTKAQSRAFSALTPSYSISLAEIQAQANDKPVGIEIGFGMGHALLSWAEAEPNWYLYGIELYQPGVGALTDGLHQKKLDHVRIIEQPAQLVFAALEDQSIQEVRIFFPDPWPKKRHHKRRIIQDEFVSEVARVLRPGGILRIATDWTPYAQWMRECLRRESRLTIEVDNIRGAGDAMFDASGRQTTNFERRGERLGHDIHDFVLSRSELV